MNNNNENKRKITVNFLGEKKELEVDKNETIFDFKDRYCQSLGYVSNEYVITPEIFLPYIHFLPTFENVNSDSYSIYKKTGEGRLIFAKVVLNEEKTENIQLTLYAGETYKDCKIKISSLINIPVEDLRTIFVGRLREDYELASSDLQKESTIHVVIRKKLS